MKRAQESMSALSPLVALLLLLLPGACGSTNEDQPSRADLANRAYVVSHESEELTVIDLGKKEVLAQVRTGGVGNHMAEVSSDFTRVFVTSSETNELVIVDASTLTVTGRLPLGVHPTHLSVSKDGRLLAVANEDDDTISFVDTTSLTEIKRMTGLAKPHFVRWASDGRYAYVANIGADHLSRVDVATLEVDKRIEFPQPPGPEARREEEFGFADAQIDRNGILYSAHLGSGQVLLYDTVKHATLPPIKVGRNPWIAFAEHPFAGVKAKYLVPNFGDETVSLIDGETAGGGGRAARRPGVLRGELHLFGPRAGVRHEPPAPGRGGHRHGRRSGGRAHPGGGADRNGGHHARRALGGGGGLQRQPHCLHRCHHQPGGQDSGQRGAVSMERDDPPRAELLPLIRLAWLAGALRPGQRLPRPGRGGWHDRQPRPACGQPARRDHRTGGRAGRH